MIPFFKVYSFKVKKSLHLKSITYTKYLLFFDFSINLDVYLFSSAKSFLKFYTPNWNRSSHGKYSQGDRNFNCRSTPERLKESSIPQLQCSFSWILPLSKLFFSDFLNWSLWAYLPIKKGRRVFTVQYKFRRLSSRKFFYPALLLLRFTDLQPLPDSNFHRSVVEEI